MKRVIALVPNILGVAPGQRVRIEQWARYLEPLGWKVDFYTFEDEDLHRILYQPGRFLSKTSQLLSCYARQLKRLTQTRHCDLLFIYREAALIGPAFIERLSKRLGVPIIYDIDDPVFLSYRSPSNGLFSFLKCSGKTHTLFRLSNHVIAINSLIAGYAARFNPSVSVIPNCVDTEKYKPATGSEERPVRIVWMGSHSTMPNLLSIAEPLLKIQETYRSPLRIIGVGQTDLPGVKAEHRQWSESTEVGDLQGCDIGLVPVPEHPWNHWKLFLKTLQYMAVGLPVIGSRMGSNAEVIQDGVNGFVVDSPDEWYDRLQILIKDPALRKQMGIAARQTVLEKYSIQTQIPRITSLFEQYA